MNLMILAGILMIVVIAVGMFAAITASNSAAQKQRTMAVIRGRSGGGDGVDRTPRNEQDKRRAEIAKKLKEQDNVDGGKKKKKASRTALLQQAGLKITPLQYWLGAVVCSMLFMLVGKLLNMSNIVILLFFFFCLVCVH